MSNIAKRPNGKWRARYRDDDGRQHARHFARKADAQTWLDQITTSVVSGTYVDPKAGKRTVESYAKTWEPLQIGADNTLALIDNALRLHIIPAIGTRAMASIVKGDIQALVKEWSHEYAPGSVRNFYEVLSRMFRAAVEDKVLVASPCRNVRLPAASSVEVVPPTVDEVRRVVDAMPERYKAAAVLLSGSGLRIGELLGLRVTDVVVPFKTIRVERQRLQTGQIGPTKSGKSRNVPVGQVVLQALRGHLEAFPSEEWLFTADESGLPVSYQAWQKVWRPAKKTAECPEMDTHDLRHFFASALIAGGASVKMVQAALGHSSPMITLRVYAHLFEGDEDRTRAIMDSTLNVLGTVRGLGDSNLGSTAGQSG